MFVVMGMYLRVPEEFQDGGQNGNAMEQGPPDTNPYYLWLLKDNLL
jgi:hypothetical protein